MLILSDTNEYEVELADWALEAADGASVDWVTRQLSQHTRPPGRPCLVLLAGSSAVFPEVEVRSDTKCAVTYGAGLPEISSDGLTIEIRFREKGSDDTFVVHSAAIPRFDVSSQWEECCFELSELAGKTGRFEVACGPGFRMQGDADWLAVYEFVVSPEDQLRLNRARAFSQFREKNEIAVFSETYKHAIYNEGDTGILQTSAHSLPEVLSQVKQVFHAEGLFAVIYAALRRLKNRARLTYLASLSVFKQGRKPAASVPVPASSEEAGQHIAEKPVQNLYSYYTSLLLNTLGLKDIDFRARLANRYEQSEGELIRILSLASGAARIEESMIEGLDPTAIELTLVDINPGLLEQAGARLSAKATVKCMVQNLNELSLPENHYDIVLCVSALHHVVELERVFGQVKQSLKAGGEFWSIGEYVGRNGSRLYEDAYECANGFFRSLPPSYRINRNPGSSGELDEDLPNLDCSLTCFEGIRSEEIEELLEEHFDALETVKFDCFLWRLFNLAYLDNYNLEWEYDLQLVQSAIDLEVDFLRSGGKPTAMWGVFAPK